MVSSNGTDNKHAKVASLRDLPQAVAPPRDLWPDIAAQLAREQSTGGGARGARLRPSKWHVAGLAAGVALLAVGIWIGRSVIPVGSVPEVKKTVIADARVPADVVHAAFVSDPRYVTQRTELVRSLEARIAALPPESQEKVTASLATIRQSMTDIEAALGKDPSNALLQELLVNTYQDEMRVLTTVHEAGNAGGGI